MVILDFKVEKLAPYRDDFELSSVDPVILETTGLELPIMFVVNGVNLFETIEPQRIWVIDSNGKTVEQKQGDFHSSWLSLPIINFSVNGLEAIRRACKGEPVTYYLPNIGSALRFQLENGNLEIMSDFNRKSVQVKCDEILEAFEIFQVKIRKALLHDVPLLKENPYWKKWLEEGSI
jgi:hypothetical protein